MPRGLSGKGSKRAASRKVARLQPLSVQNTQTLLADDEALVTFDLDLARWPNWIVPNATGYVWAMTKGRA
jgi:hypothetical protein